MSNEPISLTGYTNDPASLANSLTIDAGQVELKDWTRVPAVRIDTNYKPGRPGQYPVDLTIRDAVKAAVALIGRALVSLDENVETLDKTHPDDEMLLILVDLSNLDGNVWELRDFLQNEIQHRRSQAADKAPAGDAEATTTDEKPESGKSC
jgi:hypothetical protein